jgi:hypothetical protein
MSSRYELELSSNALSIQADATASDVSDSIALYRPPSKIVPLDDTTTSTTGADIEMFRPPSKLPRGFTECSVESPLGVEGFSLALEFEEEKPRFCDCSCLLKSWAWVTGSSERRHENWKISFDGREHEFQKLIAWDWLDTVVSARYMPPIIMASGILAVCVNAFNLARDVWSVVLYLLLLICLGMFLLSKLERSILWRLMQQFDYLFLCTNLAVYLVVFVVQLQGNSNTRDPSTDASLAFIRDAGGHILWCLFLFIGFSCDAISNSGRNWIVPAVGLMLANSIYLLIRYRYVLSVDVIQPIKLSIGVYTMDSNSLSSNCLASITVYVDFVVDISNDVSIYCFRHGIPSSLSPHST